MFRLTNASITGVVPAILEGILVYSVEPTVNPWVLAQACLFWFTCGFAIYLIDVEMPSILKGMIFSVFLCLPWYIAESVVAGKPEHFAPLVIASVLQGLIIGFLDRRLKMRKSLNQAI